MIIRRVAWSLGIAAAIPFAALTAALLAPDNHVRIPAIAALVTYSAVMLSFIGGMAWAWAVHDPPPGAARPPALPLRVAVLCVGAVVVLAAWGVFWLPSPRWQVGGSLGLFVVLWLFSALLLRQGLVARRLVHLHGAFTAVVALSEAVALYLL